MKKSKFLKNILFESYFGEYIFFIYLGQVEEQCTILCYMLSYFYLDSKIRSVLYISLKLPSLVFKLVARIVTSPVLN